MTKQSDEAARRAAWDANEHYRNKEIAADYDGSRFSSLPGRVFNSMEQKVILQAFSVVPRGAAIADLPCGTGRLAEPLLEAGFQVHGMDISDSMLDVASHRLARFGNKFTREVVDAKILNRSHDQYAAVLCARVLMHFVLEEQITFLRGVVQLTAGRIVINHSLSTAYLRVRRAFKRLLGHQPPARFPVTSEEIAKLLAGAGLREVRRYRLNRLISEAVYIVAEPIST